MAGFKYFTIGFGVTVVVLGAAAGSALGLVSGGPASPVPAKTATSGKMDMATSSAAPMSSDTVGKNSMGQPGVLHLDGMPAGAVRIWRNSQGRLEARLAVYGLTPGSSHNASIDGPMGTPLAPEVRFPTFTADSMGRANVTLTATSST